MLRYNDSRGMTRNELIGSTAVFVSAGGESVATCLSSALFYMLTYSKVLECAQTEVRGTFRTLAHINVESLSKLEYLNAVIEEALRIRPPTAGNFARRTDSSSDIIDGKVIPPYVSTIS